MKLKLILLSITIITLFGCENKPEVVNIEINNYSLLDSIFTKYSSSDSTKVTSVIVNNISPSIKKITITKRKEAFINALLANVLINNSNILLLRDTILNITDRLIQNGEVTKEELAWLNSICKTYRCTNNNTEDLLKKIDIIPPSMAIAQTIVESGWGTSRFAIEGNSLFGEHFSNGASGNSISASSSSIKMKAFPTIYDAVKSYSKNINRHRAYRKFRDKRFLMRTNNIKLNSLELVETLGSYSELGDEYIIYIKKIIRRNDLQKYDSKSFNKAGTKYYVNIKN